MKNLLPVTVGNLIGGTVIIALAYWFVYLRAEARMPVRKVMTRGPDRVLPDETVDNVSKMMETTRQSSLLVGTQAEAIGILSESDIIRKVLAEGKEPAKVRVEEIMSSPLISVDVTTPLYVIYKTMADKGIRHILITEKGKPRAI